MQRDTFQHRIQKGLIGTGSDSFGMPDEEEIITDYPLQRYYSAVIFPEKKFSATEQDEDDEEVKAATEEPNSLDPEDIISENKSENDATTISKNDSKSEDESKVSQNHFNPNNFGLTFCIDTSVESIEVDFSGGFYYLPSQEEIKIKMPENGFQFYVDENNLFPFKEILKFEYGYLFLTRGLKGDKMFPRTEEYKQYDDYKKSEIFKDRPIKNWIHFFDKLIGRTWKRKPFFHSTIIKLIDTKTEIEIPIADKTHKEVKVGYNVKTYEVENKIDGKRNKYVKIQLVNLGKKQPSKRFTIKTPELNSKCLFQAGIKVKSEKILPYKSNQELNPFDLEAEELNFLYREVQSFGIGHNCSVNWNRKENWIETTFLPEFNVKDTKNDFIESDFENPNDFKILNESLDIKNLSIFVSIGKDETIKRMFQFVDVYGKWIEQQKKNNEKNTDKEKTVSKAIINRLDYNYNRLKSNIECLKNDDAFRAFQLANTAMLIQIIISNDKSFAKEEKEKSEVNKNIPYDDLTYFQEYDYSRLPFVPKYRPFQLAFLLLSIKGITEPESEERRDVVDLIWFPTGGGKTEAYLAVTAFTIVWRRMMNNETASKGVSVIMRYTLRLLTAQQFERASKLIASLEFLRRNFKDELKSETISIGLWVGNQLTPGKVEDALKAVEEIERECTKKNGRPDLKNTFQISSCPWCGTKLISENDYGFEANTKKFYIKCLNSKCTFHNEIPIQVVDEMLFKNPPTLLFATVDKFAQLAWKGESHSFFNSLDDDKLPPDLIIQDELHLLSGPLGSIVGIFESVVEQLCTKSNSKIAPKIIASTATTRNTTQQIAKLYGGRKVNIFPPSGLTYSDSFFAKESKVASKRKYIGFMPVGKTAIDTQLQLIAHLLEARIENAEPLSDDYWTLVSYYNSLKDVGKIRNKVGDEIIVNTATLQARLFGRNNKYIFNHYGIEDRTEELTARVESSKIKAVLKQLENKFELVERETKKEVKYKAVNSSVIDLVLATNMFSVGIDIGRLNLMLINGMPKNIAEYIQASSRVGRKVEGLVVTFLDPNRARDKSYFEHYIPFHQAFYKGIEPLSVTPFTENTIDKMLTTLVVTFVRHKIAGLNPNNAAQYFQKENLDELKAFLKNRFKDNPTEYEFFENRINFLANDWEERIQNIGLTKYDELMKRPTEVGISDNDDWIVMQSMREVDADTFIQIKNNFF